MTTTTRMMPWAGIESEELNEDNFVQVAYRFDGETREYLVSGKVAGESFTENFYQDDTKRMAYDYYWEKLSLIESQAD